MNKAKYVLVAYWFISDKGSGPGQISLTLKDGVIRPGEIIDYIKDFNKLTDVIILNILPYKQWKKP